MPPSDRAPRRRVELSGKEVAELLVKVLVALDRIDAPKGSRIACACEMDPADPHGWSIAIDVTPPRHLQAVRRG